MRITGAELIVQLLERQGIRIVSGIPGGANLPLYDALSQSPRIRHVLARHEQGAGFIAQGISRASGQPGVCLATSGPGATNLVTAIADARMDSIPLVAITGQVPTGLLGTDAFQEVDAYGMTLPITKHNYLVRSAAELARVVPQAFRIALSGRPGPVLIDVPKDVQQQSLTLDGLPDPGGCDPPPGIDAARLEAAAALINASQRPILYIGGGAIHSGAHAQALRLAERASLPAVMTLMGLGVIPGSHALSLGMLGMHAARFTNLALEDCDLLIAAGARFDDRATGKAAEFCPRARIVHIDIDAAEIGKIKPAHIGIQGDVRAVLEALIPMIAPNPRPEWLSRVASLKREFPLDTPGADDPRTPYGLIRAVSDAVGPDAIITTDVGQHQMWVAQAFPFERPRRLLTSGGLGTMGFGLPAAIGAALAFPGKTVVCFSGDGSLLMNLQEMATAADEGVNVKIVLMNNGSLGMVRQQQEMFYGRRIFAADFRAATDFMAIARGFGLQACDLGTAQDPRAALMRALRQDGPGLIHAPIAAQEKVFPMVPPGSANRDMIAGALASEVG